MRSVWLWASSAQRRAVAEAQQQVQVAKERLVRCIWCHCVCCCKWCGASVCLVHGAHQALTYVPTHRTMRSGPRLEEIFVRSSRSIFSSSLFFCFIPIKVVLACNLPLLSRKFCRSIRSIRSHKPILMKRVNVRLALVGIMMVQICTLYALSIVACAALIC